MVNILDIIASRISFFHLNILFLIGFALFGGTIGGRVFQKLKIPQVVGYMLIGLIIGQTGFNIVDKDLIRIMEPFNYFALGLIGFMIGGELKKDVFTKYGKQLIHILLFEGLTAFFIVFLLVGLVGSLFFDNMRVVWAIASVLGAISSATAPAATTDVLWEYKTRGPLTTTVIGIVALDDALALALFAVASSIAARLIGNSDGNMLRTIFHPFYEIGGSIIIGSISGFVLTRILKVYNESEKILAFSIGAVLLVLGLSLALNLNMLLSAMILGVVIVNFSPRMSKDVFNLVKGFSPPIYVLFFVMVGASLNFYRITPAILAIATTYLVGMAAGKMLGSYLGAIISKAPITVRKYLPFCLFSQAGVAIGLSIVAYHIFPEEIGHAIIIIITLNTFLVQLFGPYLTKLAVTKAGEAGLNITEDDLIKRTRVKDLMDKNFPLISENMPLATVLKIFAADNNLYYPVIDNDKKLVGIISVDSIKQTFMETDIGQFLLAFDLMEKIAFTIGQDAFVSEAKEIFNKYDLDYLPVVKEDNIIVGLIEERMLNKLISTKMMELKKKIEQLG
ncbi:MAG: cation:proton antiporter [bacterium]